MTTPAVRPRSHTRGGDGPGLPREASTRHDHHAEVQGPHPPLVAVLADGFELEGQRYRSLTAVAKAITGSHMNGFRFFGLEGKP